MTNFVLAADLGGTNLRVAAVNPSGEIIKSARHRTRADGSFAELAEQIARAARTCLDELDRESRECIFSLAVPALLDARKGVIFNAPNLPQLDGGNLAEAVAERLGCRVLIENDANAAALGEYHYGASRGAATSVCVTLGTGVGGGLILDGRLWRGIDGTAGEIGHLCVEPEGAVCGCGSRGCLEQYASASAIVRMTSELGLEFSGTRINLNGRFSARDVYEAGKAGDRLAIEVFRRVGFYLGTAFAGLANLLNPEVIVIGGGAAAGWDLFIDEARRQVTEKAFSRPAERVKLVRAELGEAAGILGAARLAFEAVEQKDQALPTGVVGK